MQGHYDEKIIQKIKAAVLSGRSYSPADTESVSISVLRSWLCAQKAGLDPTLEILPSEMTDWSTKERVTTFMRYEYEERHEFYICKNRFLASMGYAVIYLESQLCVVNTGGDLGLIEELKGKGIKFGMSFSEQHIGTSAVSQLNKKNGCAMAIGEEHYLNVLTPYATAASYLPNKNVEMVQVLFCRRESYGEPFRATAKMMYFFIFDVVY